MRKGAGTLAGLMILACVGCGSGAAATGVTTTSNAAGGMDFQEQGWQRAQVVAREDGGVGNSPPCVNQAQAVSDTWPTYHQGAILFPDDNARAAYERGCELFKQGQEP
jgi:hypothetical protein